LSDFRTLFEKSVAKWPQNIAVQNPIAGTRHTYAQLRELSIYHSTFLQNQGVEAGAALGICLPKSAGAVSIILAAASDQWVYIPMDIEAPQSRLNKILENAGVAGFFCDTEKWQEWSGICPFPFEVVPTADPAILWIKSLNNPRIHHADLAYILYTSGSTGIPKGVCISCSNATCFVDWAVAQFELNSNDVCSSLAPFHFDLSVFDLFASLRVGASVVLVDHKSIKNPMLLVSWITEFDISVWYATPTTLKLMLRFGRMDNYNFSALRLLLFAGEVMPVSALRQLKQYWNNALFYNLYGPTETNVCTWFKVPDCIPEDRTDPFPIGFACPYANCYVRINEEFLAPEPGLIGELYVGGHSVMQGYLSMPEKTAESLVNTTWGTLYKTGDLVSISSDGALIYSGRVDRMVKRHGYRIELGEIENALSHHTVVAQTAVVSIQRPDQLRIIVFYQPNDSEVVPSNLEFNIFLQQHLPAYMLPDQYQAMEKWPETSSGKTDYSLLLTKAEDLYPV
jgi:amino acid adenylation domain-containing protein